MARTFARTALKVTAPRRWLTVFALLAFFLQGLTLQTHIHPLAQPLTAKTAALQLPAPAPSKNQDPIDQCRLCQELAHAGTFVTPSAAIAVSQLTIVTAIFTAVPVFAGTPARAFAWQGRAPPRQ